MKRDKEAETRYWDAHILRMNIESLLKYPEIRHQEEEKVCVGQEKVD